MKMKIKTLVLAALLCLLLSSCSAIPGYSEPENSLVATALGFDPLVDGEGIRVSVQVSEGADGKGRRTLSGEGTSIEGAIASLSASETKRIEYSHVAVVVLGTGTDGDVIQKILEFCDKNEEISVSARLISADGSEGLLSDGGFSGYELLSMITSGVGASLSAEDRLYQVLRRGDGVFALPHFASNGEGYELYGARIYRGGEGRVILGREEAAIYMMMRGHFRGDPDGASVVESCKTSYGINRSESGEVTLRVVCEIKTDEPTDALFDSLRASMKSLYNTLSSRHGDLFGFAERVGEESFRVEFECKERGK